MVCKAYANSIAKSIHLWCMVYECMMMNVEDKTYNIITVCSNLIKPVKVHWTQQANTVLLNILYIKHSGKRILMFVF